MEEDNNPYNGSRLGGGAPKAKHKGPIAESLGVLDLQDGQLHVVRFHEALA